MNLQELKVIPVEDKVREPIEVVWIGAMETFTVSRQKK